MAQPDFQVLQQVVVDTAEIKRQQGMIIQQLQQNRAEDMQRFDRIQQGLEQAQQRLDELRNGLNILPMKVYSFSTTGPTRDNIREALSTATDQQLHEIFATQLEIEGLAFRR